MSSNHERTVAGRESALDTTAENPPVDDLLAAAAAKLKAASSRGLGTQTHNQIHAAIARLECARTTGESVSDVAMDVDHGLRDLIETEGECDIDELARHEMRHAAQYLAAIHGGDN